MEAGNILGCVTFLLVVTSSVELGTTTKACCFFFFNLVPNILTALISRPREKRKTCHRELICMKGFIDERQPPKFYFLPVISFSFFIIIIVASFKLILDFLLRKYWPKSGYACSAAVKVPVGKPTSLIECWQSSPSSTVVSSFLLMQTLEGSRWWLKQSVSCCQVGDSLSFRLLTLAHSQIF